MDYEGTRDTASETPMGDIALGRTASDLTANAAASAGSGGIALIPDANNTVILPDGATLDDITVRGRDLVIQTDDGRIFIIPDGAVFVPQIVAQGVTVPPLNLAALLIGQEPEPAAGPVRSSGGNFAVPVDPLQDAYDLGDLLPYTELAFPEPRVREIFPPADSEPEIIIFTPDNPAGAVDATDSVDEAGLPERGDDESEDLEPQGTDAASNSETTAGTIQISSPDGIGSLTVGGVAVDLDGVTVITTPRGVLTITGNGTETFAYSYTLTDNTSGDNTTDPFTVVVTDTDGDTATGTLTIRIIDDEPIARNDTDTVAAGTYGPETGNVLSGSGTTSGAAGADTTGADDASLTGVRVGTTGTFVAPGGTLDGTYGTLVLNPNGSYSYVRDPGTPGGVSDVFSYQITDGDGDTSTATLTINIADAQPLAGENAVVRLDDDALTGGNDEGLGDDVNAANVTGTLNASGGDGPLTWALSTSGAPAGFSYVANGTGIDIFQGETLVLQVTLDTATGAYAVTQVAPIQHIAGNDENNTEFPLQYSVTDQDGDPATGSLTINVDDDTPVVRLNETEISILTVDETDLSINATANYSSFFTAQFGADGAAASGSLSYALGINPGATGLIDTATGLAVVLTVESGQVVGRAGADGEIVFTVAVDGSGNVTLDQQRAVIHGDTANPNDAALFSAANLITLSATATDRDGDTASQTVNIADLMRMLDDGPDAQDDADSVKEDGPSVADGNVFTGSGGSDDNTTDGTADSAGADGAPSTGAVTAIAGGTVGTMFVSAYGSFTIAANGDYAYILDNSNTVVQTLDDGETLTEQFSYTITDRDGDTDIAILTITIQGTNDAPLVFPATTAVSEEGLALANADDVGSADTTNDAVVSGTIVAGDIDGEPLIFTLGTPPTALTSNGVAITWTGAGTGTLIGSAGDTEVIRVTIDGSGNYTVTLSDQVDHPVTGSEDDLDLEVPVNVSDGTLTTLSSLTVSLEDDSPVVSQGSASGTVDEDGLTGGNTDDATGDVVGAATTASGSVTGLFSAGADTALSFSLSTATAALTAQGLTSGGVALTYAVEGNLLTASAGGSPVFTLSLDASAGTWSFSLLGKLDHASGEGENDITIELGAMIVATDRDGDKVTAGGLALTVVIDDDTPVLASDRDAILSGSSAPATGNVLTDNDPGDAGDTDDGADRLGADGGTITGIANSNDVPGTIGGTTAGLYGVLTLNSDGSYSYTRNAGTPGNVEDVFTYTVTDGDGDVATATLTILIEDARPVTTPNAAVLLDDDAQAGGNPGGVEDNAGSDTASGTLSGSGGDGALTWAFDLPADADGFTYEANGTGIDIKQGGTLVLQVTLDSATGDYTVTQLAPIQHVTGADENNQPFTLTYTVTDADGDFANGSLSIDVDDDTPVVTNAAAAASVTVDESDAAVVSEGFLFLPPTSTSGTAIITASTAFGADGPATSGATSYGLSLTGNVASLASGLATAIGDQPVTLNQTNATTITGTFGAGSTAFTITIDPATGILTVSLNAPLEHLVDGLPGPAHDDALDLAGLVNATITITDSDGDTASATAGIGDAIVFKDDGPSVDVRLSTAAEPVLTTQDAGTDGTPTDQNSASSGLGFNAVFVVTGDGGSDGMAFPSVTYALAVTDAVSGLSSNGTPINLYLIAGKVVASTAADALSVTAGNTVFDIAVSNSGEVTLTQYQQVDHTLEGTTTAPFNDQFAVLADGKVTLTTLGTAIDNDGDSATDSATIDLGGNIRFADDGPDISATLSGTQIRIDETDGVTAAGGETDAPGGNLGTVTLTAASLFTVSNVTTSADAPTTLGYALQITQGAASGLLLSSTNEAINLYTNASTGVIEGRVGPSNGALAFTVAISPTTGAVTLTQLLAVEHPTPGASHDEDSSGLTAGALLVRITATDFDGDTDTATVDLGTVIRFEDDGPSVTNAAAAASVTVDESDAAALVGSAFSAPVTSTSGTAIITASTAFGADGPATSGATSYGLSLTGNVASLASGLATAIGDQPVTLNQTNATTITGTYSGGTAFTISIDPATGILTVSLNAPLEHLVDGLPGPAHDDALDLAGLVNATITITDSDGDTASATAGIGDAIVFEDDGPSIEVDRSEAAEPVLTTQDAGTDGTPTDQNSASSAAGFGGVFTVDADAGNDGQASVTTSYALAVSNAVSGLTSNGVAINLYNVGGVIVGSTALSAPASATATSVVFAVAVDASGVVTLTQYQQVDHTLEGTTTAPFNDQFAILADGRVTLTRTDTITDNDGDSATDSATIDLGGNIRFADDGPDISATLSGTQIRIDETDGVTAAGGETDAPGGNLGTVTLTAASLFTVSNVTTSADAPTTLGYALQITEGAASGLLLSTTNEAINLYTNASTGVIEGRVGPSNGALAFTVAISPTTGAVTLTQLLAVEHPTPGASHDEDSSGLTAGALLVRITATDFDGDTDTASVDLGSVIRFEDDGPSVTASLTQPTLIVDETLLGSDATLSFASVFTTAFGSDGAALAGGIVYTLGINAGATGLVDVATGNTVVLTRESGVVVGRAGIGGPIVFTVSVAADGNVTLDQQRAVQHNDPLDHDESGVSAAGLAADNLITLTATLTDSDGDTASATANIGSNLAFEDDGPAITSVTTPLAILNSGTVSNTGNFVFTTGNDGAVGLNDAIRAVTFAGTVNGVAVTNPLIAAGTENATTANYSFGFTYATGASTTATATGTLVFNKIAGTYTVDLDAPIQGFAISGTASGTAFLGYQLNSAASDNSQPAVSVTQISPNLFLQFTSVAEPSSGNGADNLGTTNYGLDVTPPNDGNNLGFSNGELFNQAAGWVSISNTANGVNGDTIGQGEVLDFNLYSSNPQGFVGQVPTTSTTTMYLKFDGIGSGEDFIMLLKLWNPSTGEYTTRALMVQNSDIQKGPGNGPGIFSGITLDQNDGLIVIEANDYNLAGQNFVIVGAQIAGSDEGISGSAYNFNNATGAGGGSTAAPLQAFSTDTGDGPMKISDIGFVVTSLTAQSAQLVFGVTVQDRDGDTASQTLTVNIGASGAEAFSAKSGGTTTTFAEARSSKLEAASVAAGGLVAAMVADTTDPVVSDDLAAASLDVEVGTQAASLEMVSDLADGSDGSSAASELADAAEAPVAAEHLSAGDDGAAAQGELDQAADRFADHSADGSKSALFGQADNAMEALLAPGAFAATGGPAQGGDLAIIAALEDSANAEAVDAIVEHFAGAAESMPEQLGQDEAFGFESLLQLGVSGGGSDLAASPFGAMQMIDHDEQAAAMA